MLVKNLDGGRFETRGGRAGRRMRMIRETRTGISADLIAAPAAFQSRLLQLILAKKRSTSHLRGRMAKPIGSGLFRTIARAIGDLVRQICFVDQPGADRPTPSGRGRHGDLPRMALLTSRGRAGRLRSIDFETGSERDLATMAGGRVAARRSAASGRRIAVGRDNFATLPRKVAIASSLFTVCTRNGGDAPVCTLWNRLWRCPIDATAGLIRTVKGHTSNRSFSPEPRRSAAH